MSTETKVMGGVLGVTLLLLVGFAVASRPAKVTKTESKPQVIDTTGAWATGDDKVPVSVVEFADFQCPACGKAFPIIEQILKDYPSDKVRLVHRHFPLTQIHEHAMIAALTSEAAGAQGKFWGMHDLLYQHQDDWANSNDPMPFFEQYAQALDLDLSQFKKDIKDKKGQASIERDQKEGDKVGVQATPTIFVNGQGISGVPTYDELKKVIDDQLAKTSKK